MLRMILPLHCLKDSFIHLGCFVSNKRLKITWASVRSLNKTTPFVRFHTLCWYPLPLSECKYILNGPVSFPSNFQLSYATVEALTRDILVPTAYGYHLTLQALDEAKELSLKAYGEKHLLTARLYWNTGILYEDIGDLEKAYDCFMKFYEISLSVG